MPTTPRPSPRFFCRAGATLVLALPLLLSSGCAAYLYDAAAAQQYQQCDRMVSAPERQQCLERVRKARDQASEERRKRSE